MLYPRNHGRSRRVRAGLALAGASLLALGGVATPALAQLPVGDEEDEGDGSGDGGDESGGGGDESGDGGPNGAGDATTVEKVAVYQYETTGTLPRTLTSEVPPGAVCVVEPRLCPAELEPVGGALVGGIKAVQEGEPASPQPAVAPGTTIVQILGGTPYRDSGILFPLPPVPEGQELTTLVLRMPEVPSQTYHSNSPAFRQAVLAALASIGGPNQEEFEKVFEEDPVDDAPINVEACPFTKPFEPGLDQSEDDIPSNEVDGEQVPAVDCLFGANGRRGDDGVWTFDLSIAGTAWSNGDLPYEGIYLRPAKAQNVAYGDPDPSTQSRVTWDLAGLTVESTSAEPAAPPPALDFGGGGGFGGGGDTTGGAAGGGTVGGSSGSSGSFSSPTTSGGGLGSVSSPTVSAPTGDSPQVAPPATGGTAGGGDLGTPVAAEPVGLESGSAWYVLLLVPMFLAGAWFTSRSLLSDTVVVGAGGREGAMTRLIAFQANRKGEDGPRLVDLG